MPKYFLFAVIAIISFIVSCCYVQPQPVIKLSVENRHKFYIMGAEYVKIEMGGIETNTAFIEVYNGMLVFDITITNYTSRRVRVNPEQFYFVEDDSAAYRLGKGKNFAYSPEQKLIENEKLAKEEETKYGNSQFGMAALGLLTLGYEIATSGEEKTEEEKESEESASGLILQQMDDNKSAYEKTQANLENRRKIWAEDALRITDLEPNEYIRGNVYFPLQFYATRIKLFIPVGKQIITLTYKQNKY